MIILKELIHSLDKEKKDGMVNVDDWKFTDVDHLLTMGFDFVDDYNFQTKKAPTIKIYKKKENGPDNNIKEFFYIEEKDRKNKRFSSFNDVIEYFDTYEQPEIDKNFK